MAGFIPNEGEKVRGDIVWTRELVDRDADLELGLFTTASITEDVLESNIAEPTGGSYARKDLTDATWTNALTDSNYVFSYTEQTFTATGSAFTGSIQGYFVATKSASGTQRLLAVEVDSNGPYTINEDESYAITLNITEL